MDKLIVVIIILVVLSIGIFLVQFEVSKNVDVWPINQISKIFYGNPDVSGNDNSGTNANVVSSDKTEDTEISEKEKYDSNEDGALSCELIAEQDYTINENQINVTTPGKEMSFSFDKVQLKTKLHPDNLLSVNLKYNLYPENPDNVAYSNLFLADDEKVYACY